MQISNLIEKNYCSFQAGDSPSKISLFLGYYQEDGIIRNESRHNNESTQIYLLSTVQNSFTTDKSKIKIIIKRLKNDLTKHTGKSRDS